MRDPKNSRAPEGRQYYEELVRRPQDVLAGLLDWLELDLEEPALSPETLDPVELGIPVDGFWTKKEMARSPFDPQRIGCWRRSLPMVWKAVGTLLMGERLRRLGYPVGKGSVGVSRSLGRWLERAGKGRGH